MKFLKVYIVTYKRSDVLNDLLRNLFFHTDFAKCDNTEVTIINNHTDFSIAEEFQSRVKVMHNMVRPDWSPGNLSENYNQAFLDGFRDLRNPDCQYLVTLQNDALLAPNWVSNLLEMHKKYSFVFGEHGDAFASYTPDAVRKIGMWDENFCGGQYKEADYCIRALIHNKNKSIINDRLANLFHNEKDWKTTVITTERNYQDVKGQLKRLPDDASHKKIKVHQTAHRDVLMDYMRYKWNGTWKEPVARKGWITDWTKEFVAEPPRFPKHFHQFFRYHYFEKDIENLRAKRYLLPVVRDFEKKHEGERCFLIGNGPSLRETPLELIREPSFAMNRISLIYPRTTWRPTYFVCPTGNSKRDDWKKDILTSVRLKIPSWFWDMPTNRLFYGAHDNVRFLTCTQHSESKKAVPDPPLEWFSTNPEERVCKYGTSMLVAFQLAFYMGFREIVLVGCDLGFAKPNHHFSESYDMGGHAPLSELDETMIAAHKLVKKAGEKYGVKILNATRGGQLDVYERADFNEIVASPKKPSGAHVK